MISFDDTSAKKGGKPAIKPGGGHLAA